MTAYGEHGWPPIMTMNPAMREFYEELSVEPRLLLLGWRIVVPSLLRAEIPEKIHLWYMGIHKCRDPRRNVWWPCMSSPITDMVRACKMCHRNRPEHSQPLMPFDFPERPYGNVLEQTCFTGVTRHVHRVSYCGRLSLAIFQSDQTPAKKL